MKKLLYSFAALVAIAVFLTGLYYYRMIHFDLDKLIHYNPPTTTQFYDAKGRLIANTFDKEHRLYVPFTEIPGRVIETLIATEDTAFYEHEGVSLEAILRAIIKDIIAGRAAEGASTITQQLVKTTLLTNEKKISRKLKEAIIAMRIEQLLTKDQIIERYLNHIYFGHGYYGIRTAAMGYFHKDLSQLTPKETAMLIGLPKAPSTYDPTKNLQISLARANSILYRLQTLGWIKENDLQKGIAEVPQVYTESLGLNRAPYAIDAAVKELEKDFPDIRTGGYRVDLTLDLDLQGMAEKALVGQYNKIITQNKNANPDNLNGALISIDQTNGDVLALVGGVNYAKSPFNRVTQGKRQAGSSFKPFVYLAAFDLGYGPDSVVEDTPKSYSFVVNGVVKKWEPKNYEKDFKGAVTLRDALVHSRNLATLSLVERIGMNALYQKLEAFGFVGLQRNMSIALGSSSFSPWQMSEYYTIISNYGTKVTPHLVKSIRPRTSDTIIIPAKRTAIESPESITKLIDVMKGVVGYGTGVGARVDGIDVAGKTGTTDDFKDSWFCGFTPNTQTVVWFGNDDNTPLPGRYAGGTISAPVFAEYTRNMLIARPQLARYFRQATPSVAHDDNTSASSPKEEPETPVLPKPASVVDKILSHF